MKSWVTHQLTKFWFQIEKSRADLFILCPCVLEKQVQFALPLTIHLMSSPWWSGGGTYIMSEWRHLVTILHRFHSKLEDNPHDSAPIKRNWRKHLYRLSRIWVDSCFQLFLFFLTLKMCWGKNVILFNVHLSDLNT